MILVAIVGLALILLALSSRLFGLWLYRRVVASPGHLLAVLPARHRGTGSYDMHNNVRGFASRARVAAGEGSGSLGKPDFAERINELAGSRWCRLETCRPVPCSLGFCLLHSGLPRN